MSDVPCSSVLGDDDIVHALDGNGYSLCGMMRKTFSQMSGREYPGIREVFGNEPVRCLICLTRISDGYQTGTVWIHYES